MTTTVPPSRTVIPSSRGRLDEQAAQLRAVGVGRGDVRRLRAVVERVRAAARAVDELVADDELAQLELGLERARGVRADDPADAELPHRPDVRPVRDRVRRQLVLAAVAREERDALAADLADRERRRRLPVRRLDLDLLDVLEERVEAGAAEDADLSLGTGLLGGLRVGELEVRRPTRRSRG